MLPIIVHSLVSYALPLAIGIAAGLLARSTVSHWTAHLLLGAVAIMGSIVLQYAAFLLFAGVMTGEWPDLPSADQLAYALAWFCIPAIFTCAPSATVGYVLAYILRPAQRTLVASS